MSNDFNIRNTNFGILARELSGRDAAYTAPQSKEIVLIELSHFFGHHCALPTLIRALREKKNYRFVPFVPLVSWDIDHPTLKLVIEFFVMMGIGCEPLKATPSGNHIDLAKQIVLREWSYFQGDIWNLLDFTYEDVPLGVHLVDSILQTSRVAEIDQNLNTVLFSIRFISRYIWWVDYLNCNAVEFIFGSHPCYEFALPHLAAKKLGIDAFYWRDDELVRCNPILPIPHGNEAVPNFLVDSWSSLSPLRKRSLVMDAQKELEARARGQRVGGLKSDVRFYKDSKKVHDNIAVANTRLLNIVVYLHAFTDAPCTLPKLSSGDLCSPVVSARKLLEMLESVPAHVYVKTHPSPFPQDELALDALLSKHPTVTRLPGYLSPSDVMKLGLDLVITGWGSVSHEALHLGLPVIAYSRFSPINRLLGIPVFSLGDNRSLSEAIIKAISKKLTHDDSIHNLQVYAALNIRARLDLTCSGVPDLPREGDRGRYSPFALHYWGQNVDLDRFASTVSKVTAFFGANAPILTLD